ncbi:MAG: hypothetical protein AB7K24_02605 [Gemmataceae bacterium]
MMNRRLIPVCLAAVVLSVAQGEAAKVKVWQHHEADDFEAAKRKQVVVSDSGAVILSRRLRPLANLDAAHVWDVVEDKAGNLFVATGDEGKIFKITPAGKVSVAFDCDEVQVLCLAAASDGSIYAGTGPSGLIIRIAPDGNARVLYDSPESYVWSLAVNPRGDRIYAGTGPKGRIYQVSKEGKASIFYTTKQEHILCLALGAKGNLYAGTDKGGLVYKIDPIGKGFVLYHTPQAEVRSLLVTREGVYAGTSSPVSRKSLGSGGKSSGLGLSETSEASPFKGLSSESSEEKVKAATSEGSSKSSSSSSRKESKTATVPPPADGENSIFRILPDGTVREVFRAKTLMLTLLREEGKVLVGTGMNGQIFEIVEATRERTELARLDHGQVHCLKKRQDGSIIIGTGDPGKLYVLEEGYTPRGSLTSSVLDAKIVSKWGALRWQADTPPGTSVSVAVRTGNVEEPDETWSGWSAEQFDGENASVTAPSARFLQYRVTLASKEPQNTPVLRQLSIRYMTTNQPPEVSEIVVPDIESADLDNPKKLKFKWKATDANEDELTYSFLVRKEGWDSWVLVDEDIEKKEYEWDTTTMPSGNYRVKIVASDRRDNPADQSLSGLRISAPIVVTHEPPRVVLKLVELDGGQAVLEATASNKLVRLTAASFSLNGRKWVNVFPRDGLLDGVEESFRFKTETLKSGTYVLVLRVVDAAGNTGSHDVVFTVK